MNRTIIGSEAALVDSLRRDMKAIGLSVETIEDKLGIEFAYTDGTYASDHEKNADQNSPWEWENMDLDMKVYRKTSKNNFPNTYPILMLYSIRRSYDRHGEVRTCVFEFVTKEQLAVLR